MLMLLLLIFAFFAELPASGFVAGEWKDGGEPARRDSVTLRLARLNDELGALLSEDSGTERRSVVTAGIEEIIATYDLTDSLMLSDAYYFLGHHYLLNNSYSRSREFFALSVDYRESAGVYDRRHALGISNMAIAQRLNNLSHHFHIIYYRTINFLFYLFMVCLMTINGKECLNHPSVIAH